MGIENAPEHPTCTKCNGKGTVKNSKGEEVTCLSCGGKGKIY